MGAITDDLGYHVELPRPIRRVVSLVPSLTESVASVDAGALVAATDWCTHPADLDVPRIRGTKNPDVAAIVALQPDLVLANKEENRRKDVETLRAAGVPVWVTDIRTVGQALASLERMFVDALGWPSPVWIAQAAAQWAEPAPTPQLRAVVPIWRDPWMVVGRATFTGDLISRLGIDNPFAQDEKRYPHTTAHDIVATNPDLILLPDEPYVFSATDGPEAFPGIPTALLAGRQLTWYGPSLATARSVLTDAIRGPRPT